MRQSEASQDRCTRITAALAANEKARADYKSQVKATNAIKKVDMAGLRADIRLIKASAGYTLAIGEDLGIVTPPVTQTIASGDKASAKAEARGDTVIISWKKGTLDGVNVYMRRQGESDWRRLNPRHPQPVRGPDAPLLKPGVPEVREYRVTGVIKDKEVWRPERYCQRAGHWVNQAGKGFPIYSSKN